MRLLATFGVLCLTGLASAAPVPFIESAVPEAVLETSNQQRSEALLRWLKAADLAQQLVPSRSALPSEFTSRLKAEIQPGGGRVVLRLQGAARPDDRALFKALVGKVTRTGAVDPRLAMMQAQLVEEQVMINRKMLILRGGAMGGRVWRGDDFDMEQYQRQLADQEIRANPPKLVTRAR